MGKMLFARVRVERYRTRSSGTPYEDSLQRRSSDRGKGQKIRRSLFLAGDFLGLFVLVLSSPSRPRHAPRDGVVERSSTPRIEPSWRARFARM